MKLSRNIFSAFLLPNVNGDSAFEVTGCNNPDSLVSLFEFQTGLYVI